MVVVVVLTVRSGIGTNGNLVLKRIEPSVNSIVTSTRVVPLLGFILLKSRDVIGVSSDAPMFGDNRSVLSNHMTEYLVNGLHDVNTEPLIVEHGVVAGVELFEIVVASATVVIVAFLSRFEDSVEELPHAARRRRPRTTICGVILRFMMDLSGRQSNLTLGQAICHVRQAEVRLGADKGQNPYWEDPKDAYMLWAPKHSGV